MKRRDARESKDRSPQLLVLISGHRIWHMSGDRQVGGTLGS